MVWGKHKKPAVGRALTLDGAPEDAGGIDWRPNRVRHPSHPRAPEKRRPQFAPRGQRRAQDTWQGGVPQVATTVYFWYSRICHEVHASWQWGWAMVALASAIAHPSLLTWPQKARKISVTNGCVPLHYVPLTKDGNEHTYTGYSLPDFYLQNTCKFAVKYALVRSLSARRPPCSTQDMLLQSQMLLKKRRILPITLSDASKCPVSAFLMGRAMVGASVCGVCVAVSWLALPWVSWVLNMIALTRGDTHVSSSWVAYDHRCARVGPEHISSDELTSRHLPTAFVPSRRRFRAAPVSQQERYASKLHSCFSTPCAMSVYSAAVTASSTSAACIMSARSAVA